MFRNTFQDGFFTVFNSCGSKPLAIWKCQVCNGHTKRLTDFDVNRLVFEMLSENSTITFITTPIACRASLAIKLPIVTLVVKNLQKYFSFEIQIRDDQNQLRRLHSSNFQSKTQIQVFCVQMPLCLADGWNQIQLNLADLTQRAFGTKYLETVRIRVNANCRLRHIYFTDRFYADHEKPREYRLNIDEKNKRKTDLTSADEIVPPTSPADVKPRENFCRRFQCQAECAEND